MFVQPLSWAATSPGMEELASWFVRRFISARTMRKIAVGALYRMHQLHLSSAHRYDYRLGESERHDKMMGPFPAPKEWKPSASWTRPVWSSKTGWTEKVRG